jgi:hypothetical protein
MNLTRHTFEQRREIGIVVRDRANVAELCQIFERDWSTSKKWQPPNPLHIQFGAEANGCADTGLPELTYPAPAMSSLPRSSGSFMLSYGPPRSGVSGAPVQMPH